MALSTNAPDDLTAARGPCAPGPAFLLILFFILLFTWPQAEVVWRTGAFGDADDAARMAQVRDFLSGQGWFDLTQRRLAPPVGHESHWTRVVDAPLAAMIGAWSLLFERHTAETLGRLCFTFSLLVLLLWATARLARTLLGPAGVLPALAAVALSGLPMGQFQWGRIDHHAPQLIVILFVMEAALRSLEPGQAWRSTLVGLWAALSLSINIETIGLVAVACAAGPCAWACGWAWRGGERRALFGLAGGLAAGLCVGGLAFIPHGEAARAACDAISPAIVSAGLAAAAALGCLGALAPRLDNPRKRLAAGTAAALAAVGFAAWLNPHCLGNPYGEVDPVVYALWQSLVSESRPLAVALHDDFWAFTSLVAPFAVTTLAMAYAAWTSVDETRLKWLTLLAAALVAWMVISIEVRGASQLAVVGLWGGAFLVLRLTAQRPALAMATLFALSPFAWAIAAPRSAASAEKPWESCYRPETFDEIARLPPGVVAGPTFLGSHILVHTPHSALAAPYHRMSNSIRAAMDIFMADPDTARDLAATHGVRYVAMCFDRYTLERIKARAPDGLAARLERGEQMPWLRLAVAKDHMRFYEARPADAP